MKSKTKIRIALVLACLLAVAAWAADWASLGVLTADGGAKQFEPGRALSECRLVGMEGTSAIHTLVVRTDADKRALRVGRKLGVGDEAVIALDVQGAVTALRISDGGGGRYEAFIR